MRLLSSKLVMHKNPLLNHSLHCLSESKNRFLMEGKWLSLVFPLDFRTMSKGPTSANPPGVLQHSHFQKAADLSCVIIKFSLLLFNLCHL